MSLFQTSGGNVGIGMTNPSYLLDVNGQSRIGNPALITDASTALRMTTSGGVAYFQAGTALTPYSVADIVFTGIFATPEFMRIKSTGNVGIGTTSPGYILHVNTTATTGQNIASFFSPSLASGGQSLSILLGTGQAIGQTGVITYLNYGTNSTNVMQFSMYGVSGSSININATGVGIGTTNPSCPLDVRGTGSVALSAGYYFSSGTSTLGSFGAANYNLSIFASNQIGASAFNASSDRRIKENIHTLTNALETVNKLRPVTYNYIDKLEHGEKTSHGFIAQEVEEVVPDAVGQTTAVVPTIYRQANAFTETTITVTGHGLKTEKKLEVVDPENGKTTIDIVRVIDADNLEVKFEKVPKDKLFVVGPEVDDSRVLNHDHLMAVGFGGLKELHALVKTQQTTIEMLTERLSALEAKLNSQ